MITHTKPAAHAVTVRDTDGVVHESIRALSEFDRSDACVFAAHHLSADHQTFTCEAYKQPDVGRRWAVYAIESGAFLGTVTAQPVYTPLPATISPADAAAIIIANGADHHAERDTAPCIIPVTRHFLESIYTRLVTAFQEFGALDKQSLAAMCAITADEIDALLPGEPQAPASLPIGTNPQGMCQLCGEAVAGDSSAVITLDEVECLNRALAEDAPDASLRASVKIIARLLTVCHGVHGDPV